MAETKGNYDIGHKMPYSHINMGIDYSYVGGKRGWYLLNKRVPANAKIPREAKTAMVRNSRNNKSPSADIRKS